MADADTVWVIYVADYDTGRQHSRIIPESVHVLRTSTHEVSLDELEAERERTGLDIGLRTMQIEVPPEVPSEKLAAYAERYISLEPGFDFFDDVIGDDIVVAGIAYNGDVYAPDGEGGVRPLTDAEQAAREATIRQQESERAAEQTAREAQRRREAIDYATTTATTPATTPATPGAPRTAVPPDHPHAALLRELEGNPAVLAGLANNAIDRFLDHRRSGLDVEAARGQAATETGAEYATAWRTIDWGVPAETAAPPDTADGADPGPPTELDRTEADGTEDEVIIIDPRTVLPALPALRGFHLAEEAIGRFLDNREAGLDVLAARQRAVTVHATANQTANQAAPEAGADQNTAEQAVTPAATAGRQSARQVSDLRERSANLRSTSLLAAEHAGASPTAHHTEQTLHPGAEHRVRPSGEAEPQIADALSDTPDDARYGSPSPSEHEPNIGP